MRKQLKKRYNKFDFVTTPWARSLDRFATVRDQQHGRKIVEQRNNANNENRRTTQQDVWVCARDRASYRRPHRRIQSEVNPVDGRRVAVAHRRKTTQTRSIKAPRARANKQRRLERRCCCRCRCRAQRTRRSRVPKQRPRRAKAHEN